MTVEEVGHRIDVVSTTFACARGRGARSMKLIVVRCICGAWRADFDEYDEQARRKARTAARAHLDAAKQTTLPLAPAARTG